MMLRSFIAVEVPSEIQRAISHDLAPLQKALPKPIIRWVAPQNVHLTLKFLGDVSPANLERVADVLRVEAGAHPAFSMTVVGIGAFPSPHRARVIWVGLEAPPALSSLQRGVEAASASLGSSASTARSSPDSFSAARSA